MRSNAVATLLAITTVVMGTSGWGLFEPTPSPGSNHSPVPMESTGPTSGSVPGGMAPPGTPSPTPAPQPSRVAQVAFTAANFERYQPNADAITYKPGAIPVGSGVTVFSTSQPEGRTTVLLTVQGLLPNRRYGAHVHEKRCGAKGDDAGPHYQNSPDPVQPSVDPAYANPRNEIWLDFTTDKNGNATTSSTVNWHFTDRHPGSIVVHAQHTQTQRGRAGVAGARLGCVNVDF